MKQWIELKVDVITFDEILEEVSQAAASCGGVGCGGCGCCATEEWFG